MDSENHITEDSQASSTQQEARSDNQPKKKGVNPFRWVVTDVAKTSRRDFLWMCVAIFIVMAGFFVLWMRLQAVTRPYIPHHDFLGLAASVEQLFFNFTLFFVLMIIPVIPGFWSPSLLNRISAGILSAVWLLLAYVLYVPHNVLLPESTGLATMHHLMNKKMTVASPNHKQEVTLIKMTLSPLSYPEPVWLVTIRPENKKPFITYNSWLAESWAMTCGEHKNVQWKDDNEVEIACTEPANRTITVKLHSEDFKDLPDDVETYYEAETPKEQLMNEMANSKLKEYEAEVQKKSLSADHKVYRLKRIESLVQNAVFINAGYEPLYGTLAMVIAKKKMLPVTDKNPKQPELKGKEKSDIADFYYAAALQQAEQARQKRDRVDKRTDLKQASRQLKLVLAIDPDYPEAASKREQIKVEITSLKKQKKASESHDG